MLGITYTSDAEKLGLCECQKESGTCGLPVHFLQLGPRLRLGCVRLSHLGRSWSSSIRDLRSRQAFSDLKALIGKVRKKLTNSYPRVGWRRMGWGRGLESSL